MARSRAFGRLVIAGLLAAAVLASAVPGLAAPMRLRVENAATGVGVVITDNGAGDLDSTLGSIVASPVFGLPFAVTIGIGASTPPLPGGGNLLTLTGVVVAAGAGAIRYFLENDDYFVGTSVDGAISSTLSGTDGSSISLQSWLHPANLVPDFGPDVSTPGALPAVVIPAGSVALFSPAVSGLGASFDSATEPFSAPGAYSLFAEGIIAFTGAGNATFTDTLAVVTPEPGTIVLLGVGLIALAVLPLFRRSAGR